MPGPPRKAVLKALNKVAMPQRLSCNTSYETAQDPSGPRGFADGPNLADAGFQPAHRPGWQAVGSLQAPQRTSQEVPHLPLRQGRRAELFAQEQSGLGTAAGVNRFAPESSQMKLRLLVLAVLVVFPLAA